MDYTLLAVTLVAMVFSAFFSGMEIAFSTSNRVRVELDAQKKGLVSRLVNYYYSHSSMFVSTLMTGNSIMLVVYGLCMSLLLEPFIAMISGERVFILVAQVVIAASIILVAGEFMPKTISRINPNLSLRHFAIPLLVFYIVLSPISWITRMLSLLVMRLSGTKTGGSRQSRLTVGELDDYIQQTIDEKRTEGAEPDHDIEQEVRIFQNALDFSDTLLRDCMIPRNEIVAVDIDHVDRTRLCRRFSETGLSKIIVFRDDIDNVLGYIHVNELFDVDTDWKTRVKQVEFAPGSMLANAMMRKLLAEKKSIAIVVDEFGGTDGLVTLEDLVEEIFGEFEDEHDRTHFLAEKVDKNTYNFSGRIEIERLNEDYGFDIPEDEAYQTLAGYVIHCLGTLPQQGETFTTDDGLKITVLRRSSTRIELLRVERIDPDAGMTDC